MAAAPPSARSAVIRWGEAAAMASVMSRTWKAIASTQAPRQMGPARAAGDAGDDAAGRGIPLGAAQPGERGHEDDAAAVGHRGGQGPDLGGTLDDAEPVAQPLDGGAGDEGRALERVGHAVASATRSPRSQAQLTVRPSGAAGRTCPALASTKLPVP